MWVLNQSSHCLPRTDRKQAKNVEHAWIDQEHNILIDIKIVYFHCANIPKKKIYICHIYIWLLYLINTDPWSFYLLQHRALWKFRGILSWSQRNLPTGTIGTLSAEPVEYSRWFSALLIWLNFTLHNWEVDILSLDSVYLFPFSIQIQTVAIKAHCCHKDIFVSASVLGYSLLWSVRHASWVHTLSSVSWRRRGISAL